jgi:DNA-binding transcriptional regulator YiaG
MFYPFPAVNIGDLIVTSSYLNSPYDLLSSSRTETPTVLQRPRMRDPFVSPPYWYSDDKVIAVQPAQVDIKNEVRLLRNAIERSGQLSRGQIAAILGVSRRSLSAWVSGETTPSEQNLGGLRTLGELAQELVRQQTLPLGAILRDPDSADAVVEAVQDVDLPRAIRAALRTDSDNQSIQEEPPPALSADQERAIVAFIRNLLASPELPLDDPDEQEPGSFMEEAHQEASRLPLRLSDFYTPRPQRRHRTGA